MTAIKIYHALEELPQGINTAVAMGFFDGVHLGHRQVVSHAVEAARKEGLAPAVFTFNLPVSSTMKGKRLQTQEQKYQVMEELGVEYFLEPSFETIVGFSPREFVEEMMGKLYHARALFCGENFTFGKKAAGNVEVLRQLCGPLGIQVGVVPMAEYQGQTVSSTRIRKALEEGEMEQVTAMLGRPYQILFPVVHGQKLGRTLGMPTINQKYPEGFQIPRLGIYITRVRVNGEWRPSITGLGSRPTVNSDPTSISCETFIPGYEGDLYDKEVPLEFCRYLEPSHKFENVVQLRQAVMNWADQALLYHGCEKSGE